MSTTRLSLLPNHNPKCIPGVNATDICCVTVTDASRRRRRRRLDGRVGRDDVAAGVGGVGGVGGAVGAGGAGGAGGGASGGGMRRLTSSAVVSFEVGQSVSESRYDSSEEFSDAIETSVTEGESCKNVH